MDAKPVVSNLRASLWRRNLESERPSDTANLALHRSSWIENQGTENSRDDLDGALLERLKTITNSFPEECTSLSGGYGEVSRGVLMAEPITVKKLSITNSFPEECTCLSGGYGEVYRGALMGEPITVKKLSNLETLADSFSHQLVQSLMHPTCKYCNPSIIGRFTVITDASCGWRNLHQIIKPNCERSHHSHKNHTGQFSNILLDENLEPRIYDTNVSCPFDQEHIWDSEFISQMDLIWIFYSGASFSSVRNLAVFDGLHDFQLGAVGVAKGQIIIRNSSVRCPLVKMLLPSKEIKVPVSWRSLNQKTRHLKRNVTFRCCSSLLIRIETLTEKKTAANGNGKGADNGSSEEVSSYEANDGLHASTETPMSQIESSISRPDETATVDISSVAPTRTLESTWYIASAATHHMTGVQDLLTNYTAMSGELDVHTPNMGRMQVFGSGSVNTANITLQDVWHVPGLDVNLVSTSQLTKLGHTVSLGSYGCRINKDSDGALIGSAHFTDDYLFAVDFLNVQPNN